jgi:8-oxo-dGTP diphosphatase
MTRAWVPVVAGALMRGDGLWLMHRRPLGKHHGGLWEFPGGKVEDDEMPVESLVRELREELGIACDPARCQPVSFAQSVGHDDQPAIVILLYTVTGWEGEPVALEGGQVGWFTPEEVRTLAKPPLDIQLAADLLG